jgi:hypothetical protein
VSYLPLKITQVKPEPDYSVVVNLSNGCSVVLDMSMKFHTARFCGLKNAELFAKVKTDGNCIYWNQSIEMSITDLLDFAHSERLAGLEEDEGADDA